MRRKEPPLIQNPGRGRSLIAMRTNQSQTRKNQPKSQLPRSYSSPAAQNDPEPRHIPQKGYVLRSYSSPEPKQFDYRRNSDSFFRPAHHGSRSEIDSDLENFEQFEDYFLDIDSDQGMYGMEREEPTRVVTSMLPGSGIQKISIRPVTTQTAQTMQGARESVKKLQRNEHREPSRLNFRQLVVKMPTPASHSDQEQSSPGVEELQTSPQTEQEGTDLDKEFDNAEQHLDGGVAMALEESDGDTVSDRYK